MTTTPNAKPAPPEGLPVELPTIPLDWDNAADRLVGTTTVVEIQHYDAVGALLRHEHVWGQVTSADQKNGIRIMVGGRTFAGKLMVLPAQLDSFTKPAPGIYRLRSTGEEVTDPHWFTTWMVTNADQVKAKDPKSNKPPKVVDVKRKR
jgi:hypothetical protein